MRILRKKLIFSKSLGNLMTIDKIRVSIGSASVLGLYDTIRFKDPPTTCYIMTYKQGHCDANCGFCPQARESVGSTEKLSRVNWPEFSFKDFLTRLSYLVPNKRFKRICIQTLNYSNNFHELLEIISEITRITDIPISVASPPITKENMRELKNLGIDRIGIALDASTQEIFNNVKGKNANGPYSWEKHFASLEDALNVFNDGKVTTHLIVGLGETSKEILELIQKLNDLKIHIGLFAFTPIKGTKLENLDIPELLYFRKMQLGLYLIIKQNKRLKDFTFNSKGDIVKYNINKKELWDIIDTSNVMLTSGCPGCNRPYYTSRPSGPIYNYPRELTEIEKQENYNALLKFVN
jgi:biotin synthase-related radical SAM superfamily protein